MHNICGDILEVLGKLSFMKLKILDLNKGFNPMLTIDIILIKSILLSIKHYKNLNKFKYQKKRLICHIIKYPIFQSL